MIKAFTLTKSTDYFFLSLVLLFLFLFPYNINAQDFKGNNFMQIDSILGIYQDAEDYDKLLFYGKAAATKAEKELSKQDTIYAKILYNLGYAYDYGFGDYNNAISCYQKAIDILKKAKAQSPFYANTLFTLADIYNYNLFQYNKAEELYVQAKNIYANTHGVTHQYFITTLRTLAVLYRDMGNYEKSLSFFLQIKDIYIKKGAQDYDFARNLNELGALYAYMGLYEKSESIFLQAKDLYAKILGVQHREYATVLNNLASLYQTIEQYEKAELLLLESKNIRAKVLGEEHPDFAASLNNLAVLYQSMGSNEKAIPLFLKAINIRSKILGEEHPAFAASLNNLALLYHAIKNYKAAETLYLKAKNIKEKVLGKEHPSFATNLNNLAYLYCDMAQYEKAEPLFLQAIDIRKATLGSKHPEYALSLNNLANLYDAMGKLDLALDYCRLGIVALAIDADSSFQNWKALDKLKYSSNEHINSSIKVLLSILNSQYKKTGDRSKLELRYQVAQAAMRFNEQIRNDFSGDADKLRILATNNHYVLNGIQSGFELAKKGYQQEVFGFAELNKGVLLMDAAKSEKAYQFGDLPDTLAIKERLLQKTRSDLQAKLLEKLSNIEKDSLRNLLIRTNQEIDHFTQNIKSKYPKYAAIKYENKIAKAIDIQELLNNKTALLEYVISDSAIYIFYLDKKNVLLERKPINAQILATKIKTFHGILSNYKILATDSKAAYRQYTENAYWFYENLLATALKSATGISNLIIVSDGELGHLPFEAFLTKPALQKETNYNQLSYLVNDYKISYNYSATLWKEEKEKKHRSNNGQIFGMTANYDIKLDTSASLSTKIDWRLPAHQRLREGLGALPAARKEVEVLAKTFSGFFGFDKNASEKIFKEKAGNYAVIHLAMHGLLDNKNPILSSLAFTEDGDSVENNFLQAYEISKMNLNADLVVLSACETGYGRFDKGNGIASLAQAFAYAGAPAMIVSLWQVNDYATSEMMKNLYQNLADGMEKDEALQQAKLKYMKEAQGIAAHPAFWSPFVLMGNTDGIALGRTQVFAPTWAIIGISLAVLGGFAFAVWRKKKG